MLPDESISNMFTCLTKIVILVHALGHVLTNDKKISKILFYLLNLGTQR